MAHIRATLNAYLLNSFYYDKYLLNFFFKEAETPLTFYTCHLLCWPDVNRLPDISSAMLGLFGMSRESQFRVCNHGESYASTPYASSPHSKETRTLLQRGRGSWEGSSKQRVHGSSLAESFSGKEGESFFFLLVLANVAGHESSLLRSPETVRGFCSLIFFFFTISYYKLQYHR